MKNNNQSTVMISFRMNHNDVKAIKKMMESKGISLSGYIRELIYKDNKRITKGVI